MLPGYLLCRAEEEPLESFLEVLVEGDVDDGVDHGVRVGEHVNPEGVPGELVVGGEDCVSHQKLLGRPAKEESCYHHQDQFKNLKGKFCQGAEKGKTSFKFCANLFLCQSLGGLHFKI